MATETSRERQAVKTDVFCLEDEIAEEKIEQHALTAVHKILTQYDDFNLCTSAP